MRARLQLQAVEASAARGDEAELRRRVIDLVRRRGAEAAAEVLCRVPSEPPRERVH